MAAVPEIRVRAVNAAPVRSEGRHVLYWMTAARRARSSFALDRAAALARDLGRPLLVLEALRCDYPYASDRLHRFVLAGMAENARAFAEAGVPCHSYAERAPGEGKGLLEALAAGACAVVTDDFPWFFLPRMVEAAGRALPVRLEAVDGNGLLPMRAAGTVHPTAYAFRRFLQRELPRHLASAPSARTPRGPGGRIPRHVAARWPAAPPALLAGDPRALASLPIDHAVPPAPAPGGSAAGREALERFVSEGLARYLDRNHPDDGASSGLSPYLHFGHLSAHEAFRAVARREGWSPEKAGGRRDGRKEGFWGMGAAAEAFLDELVTWRELGLNMASKRPDCAGYGSLPRWALSTLEKHAPDPRPYLYRLADLEGARTHDLLWNAAQRQLLREGRIHGYLRMLWGKKIVEWSPSPRQALAAMFHLNDKYALDGRDPSSVSGITWVLGRYDRPWGPERPVFGTVRTMSSERARRKLRLEEYLRRFGPDGGAIAIRRGCEA